MCSTEAGSHLKIHSVVDVILVRFGKAMFEFEMEKYILQN
jgi:hypothetical protein